MWSTAGNTFFGGAGDPLRLDLYGLGPSLSSGAGDPLGIEYLLTGLKIVASDFQWEEAGGTRQASRFVFCQSGGEMVDVVSTLGPWPAGEYRIRLVSVLNQTFPEDAPAASSAVEGRTQYVEPLYQTVLRFALPRTPVGLFDVKIYYRGREITMERVIRMAPQPTSLEINRYRNFFNVEVYSKRGPQT